MFAPPKFSKQCEKSAKAYSEYLAALVYYNGCIARVSGDSALEGVPSSGLPSGDSGCAGRLNGRGVGFGGHGPVAVGRLLESGSDRSGDVEAERGRAGAVAGRPDNDACHVSGSASRSDGGAVAPKGRADESGNSPVSGAGGDSVRRVDALEPVRGPRGGVSIGRGPNYEKRQAEREKRRARAARAFEALRKQESDSGADRTGVAPVGLHSVRAAHPQLDETWAERKIVENRVATAKLRAQLEKLEKERADGTAERRYQVEANLVQGQLDGKFALIPQQRVISWAKTVTSNGSSSAGSSDGKKSQASIPSVSSGLGSGSATTVSAREKQLEKENEKLRKQVAAVTDDERRYVEKITVLQQQNKYYKMRYG